MTRRRPLDAAPGASDAVSASTNHQDGSRRRDTTVAGNTAVSEDRPRHIRRPISTSMSSFPRRKSATTTVLLGSSTHHHHDSTRRNSISNVSLLPTSSRSAASSSSLTARVDRMVSSPSPPVREQGQRHLPPIDRPSSATHHSANRNTLSFLQSSSRHLRTNLGSSAALESRPQRGPTSRTPAARARESPGLFSSSSPSPSPSLSFSSVGGSLGGGEKVLLQPSIFKDSLDFPWPHRAAHGYSGYSSPHRSVEAVLQQRARARWRHNRDTGGAEHEQMETRNPVSRSGGSTDSVPTRQEVSLRCDQGVQPSTTTTTPTTGVPKRWTRTPGHTAPEGFMSFHRETRLTSTRIRQDSESASSITDFYAHESNGPGQRQRDVIERLQTTRIESMARDARRLRQRVAELDTEAAMLERAVMRSWTAPGSHTIDGSASLATSPSVSSLSLTPSSVSPIRGFGETDNTAVDSDVSEVTELRRRYGHEEMVERIMATSPRESAFGVDGDGTVDTTQTDNHRADVWSPGEVADMSDVATTDFGSPLLQPSLLAFPRGMNAVHVFNQDSYSPEHGLSAVPANTAVVHDLSRLPPLDIDDETEQSPAYPFEPSEEHKPEDLNAARVASSSLSATSQGIITSASSRASPIPATLTALLHPTHDSEATIPVFGGQSQSVDQTVSGQSNVGRAELSRADGQETAPAAEEEFSFEAWEERNHERTMARLRSQIPMTESTTQAIARWRATMRDTSVTASAAVDRAARMVTSLRETDLREADSIPSPQTGVETTEEILARWNLSLRRRDSPVDTDSSGSGEHGESSEDYDMGDGNNENGEISVNVRDVASQSQEGSENNIDSDQQEGSDNSRGDGNMSPVMSTTMPRVYHPEERSGDNVFPTWNVGDRAGHGINETNLATESELERRLRRERIMNAAAEAAFVTQTLAQSIRASWRNPLTLSSSTNSANESSSSAGRNADPQDTLPGDETRRSSVFDVRVFSNGPPNAASRWLPRLIANPRHYLLQAPHETNQQETQAAQIPSSSSEGVHRSLGAGPGSVIATSMNTEEILRQLLAAIEQHMATVTEPDVPNVSPSEMEQMTKSKFDELLKDGAVTAGEQSLCSICLDEYEPSDDVVTFPPCLHRYHEKCITNWLSRNRTCPVCRSQFALPSENHGDSADATLSNESQAPAASIAMYQSDVMDASPPNEARQEADSSSTSSQLPNTFENNPDSHEPYQELGQEENLIVHTPYPPPPPSHPNLYRAGESTRRMTEGGGLQLDTSYYTQTSRRHDQQLREHHRRQHQHQHQSSSFPLPDSTDHAPLLMYYSPNPAPSSSMSLSYMTSGRVIARRHRPFTNSGNIQSAENEREENDSENLDLD